MIARHPAGQRFGEGDQAALCRGIDRLAGDEVAVLPTNREPAAVEQEQGEAVVLGLDLGVIAARDEIRARRRGEGVEGTAGRGRRP